MKNRNVWRAVAMITQIGLGMIIPIFLCVYAGVWLNEKTKNEIFFPILLMVGILAAFRNLFSLTKSFYLRDKEKEDRELQYFEELLNHQGGQKKCKKGKKL